MGNHLRPIVSALTILGAQWAGAALAHADDQATQAACANLAGFTLPASAISLPTGGAAVKSATLVTADEKGNANGEYCKVLGAIKPVDPKAPDINFEVNLPSHWNHKALQIGGGGYNGSVVTGLDNVKFARPDTPTPLAQGYVTLGSDSGHQGDKADGSFGMNKEALANFAGDQLKKTHDVAMALMKARYGESPRRFYFDGNSQGGHEGFIVIQRWPKEYDGVISIHPVYNFTALQVDGNAQSRAMYNTPGGWLNPAKLKLLQDSVMKACDRLDGAEDGVISNLAACRATFKLKALRCPKGADTGDSCLSDAQIKTVKAINSRVKFGFKLQGGVNSFARWPILEGADWTGLFSFGTRPQPSNPPKPVVDFGLTVLSDAMLRYMILQDPNSNPLAFDPKAHVARLKEVSNLADASDADIAAFKARGGKLLLMHGTVDSAVSPYNTVDYYHRLQKRFGQKKLDQFVRFYTAPGFGHGTGQFIVGWDSLSALDNWVEKGDAPGLQVITDVKPGNRARTRPLCVYPSWPKYTGKGSVDDAANFTCVKS